MRKSKAREGLRERIKATRGGARPGAGRPSDPTRTERDYLEAARARARRLAPVAVATLGKALKGDVPRQAVAAACAILDRAGLPKTVAVETDNASAAAAWLEALDAFEG